MDRLNNTIVNKGGSNNTLTATEWTTTAQKINELVDAVNENSSNTSGSDSHVVYDSVNKHNLNIVTTVDDTYTEDDEVKGGKINIESFSDIQLKPGDDIFLYAHHREAGNTDQILMKIATEVKKEKKGQLKDIDIPAKFKLNTGDITITNADCETAILVEIKDTKKKANDVDYIITANADPLASTLGNQDQYYSQTGIYLGSIISSKLSTAIEENTAVIKATSTPVTGAQIATDIIGAGIGKTRWIKWTDGAAENPSVMFYKFTKVSNADGVTNINIEDSEGYGYLKVRAQSVDIRCEEHGGIALQPKGYDGDQTPHMNKIKFEHGGGDGLEFGTFNTEKSSLFTDEYRFKKSGVIKLSTRTPEVSAKYDGEDETTHYVYPKQSDDFYDVIDANDPTCTWEDIVTIIAELKDMKTNNQGPWAQL